MIPVDVATRALAVKETASPGGSGDDGIRVMLSSPTSDPILSKARFPEYRLTRLVLNRFDMDEAEARIFIKLTGATAPEIVLGGTPFNDHLRASIERFALTALFCEEGPGRHHQAIRPTGYDYHVDAVDALAMEKWRADYRAIACAADARRDDHLALSRRQGQSLAPSCAMHLARRGRDR